MPNPVVGSSGAGTSSAVITTATSGDQEIVAAVAGKQIVVTGYVLVNTTAQTLTWKSATTAISGPMAVASLGVLSIDSGTPLLVTAAGAALNLNLGASTQVSGHCTYYLA